HARDPHALALTGRHRLRGGKRGVDRERRGLPREPEPLVGEDVAGDPDRDDQQSDDRGEVLPVLADRPLHRGALLVWLFLAGLLPVGGIAPVPSLSPFWAASCW